MVDAKKAADKIGELAMLKYFPQDELAQAALVRMICEKSETNEQIDWLVERALKIYDEWPGPASLLALFESPMMPGNMKPLSEADRRKVLAATSDQKLLGDGTIPPLPPGNVTADPRLQVAFEMLMVSQEAKEQAWDSPATPEEIASAPEWLRKLEGYED